MFNKLNFIYNIYIAVYMYDNILSETFTSEVINFIFSLKFSYFKAFDFKMFTTN